MSHMLRLLRAAVHVVMPVFAVAVLLLTSPAWRAELELGAQTCSPQIRDPECATLHSPTAAVSPRIATTSTSSIVLTAEVSDAVGIQQPAPPATVLTRIVSGTASTVAMNLTWSIKGGRGWNFVSLDTGLNTFVVTATNGQGQTSTDTARITYKKPASQTAPVVSYTNFSSASHNGYRPAVPCGGCAATLAYATPAYLSRDQPRSLALAYSSAQVAPTSWLLLALQNGGTDTARAYSLRLKKTDGSGTYVTFKNNDTELFYQPPVLGPNSITMIAAEFAAADSTAAIKYLVEARAFYSTAPGTVGFSDTATVRIMTISETNSPLGRGVSWIGIPKLYPHADGMMLTPGDGSALFFTRGSTDGTAQHFTAPIGSFATLDSVKSGAYYRLSNADGTYATFSTNGLIRSASNRFSDSTTFTWDGSGRLLNVTDPVLKRIGVDYTGTGVASLRKLTDSAGVRTSTMAYDGSGHLTSIVQPNGDTVFSAATYDANHRLTSVKSGLGGMTTYAYSATGAGWVRTITDTVPGEAIAYRVKVRPAIDTVFPPNGTSTSLASRWTPGPNATLTTLPGGVTQSVFVDRYGLMLGTTLTDPAGVTQQTSVIRDTLGRPTSASGPDLSPAFYTYSGENMATFAKGDTRQRFTYTNYNQPDSVFVNDKLVARYTYSGGNSTLAAVFFDSTAHNGYAWDSHGRAVSDTNALGAVTSRKYSSTLGNLDTVTTANGTTTVRHDTMGRATAQTSPVTGTDSVSYNTINGVTRSWNALGQLTQGGFALATRRDSLLDARNQKYLSVLDQRGRPWMAYDASAAHKYDSLSYNALGQLTAHKTRRAATITFTYDTLGRLTKRTAGSDVAQFAYDLRTNASGGYTNEWTVAWNADSRDSTRFDAQGRVSSSTTTRGGTTLAVEYQYAHANTGPTQIVWKKNGTGVDTINVDYDNYNRLISQGIPQGAASKLKYAATGVLDSLLLTGVKFKNSYVASTGQLAATETDAANTFARRTYGYDARGRMTQRTWGTYAGGEFRSLGYDNASRLASYADSSLSYVKTDSTCVSGDNFLCYQWDYTWSYVHTPVRAGTYSYDVVGNRTENSNAAVDSANRRTSWNGYTIAYDAEGNILSRNKASDSLALSWDTLGHLVQVKKNGVTTTFKYDALGRRIQKVSGGVTTNYLLDGNVTIAELDASYAVQRVYSYWPSTDRPHAVKVGSSKYTYLYEEPGNVVALANSSGTLVNTYQYDPWGADVGTTSSVTQPFRYTGRELDSETGLYYYRARYYDPGMGRFVSEDPIGLAGGINEYAYVGNDPANATDPTGLQYCSARQTPAQVFGIPICLPWQTLPVSPTIASGAVRRPKDIETTDVLANWGIGNRGVNTLGGMGDTPRVTSKYSLDAPEQSGRSTQECFSENTAWLASAPAELTGFLTTATATVLTAGGILNRALGEQWVRSGTGGISAFFGTRQMSSMILEREMALEAAGFAKLSSGSSLLRAGTTVGVALGGFVASYTATTLAICSVNPDY